MTLRLAYFLLQGFMLSVAALFFFYGVHAKERYQQLNAELFASKGALENMTAESNKLVNQINLLGGQIGGVKPEVDPEFLAEKLREQGLIDTNETRLLEESAVDEHSSAKQDTQNAN